MISLEYFAFIMVIVTGFISSIGILHILGFWSRIWRWIKYEPPYRRKWYDDKARIAAAMVKRERKNKKRLKYADAQRCYERCGD